ncbi:hypothetical protein Poli38472_003627 [Pythium oligandrum]|uniref:Ankyrin repeat protein n=1 Tax=Pythium oligandrum TaxID=41045 RepID=A0A8K1CNV8_PYTOL|nr:hypothetical protein Poli38472_003627 [Pythium oligandrum]|eukprot:TMW65862.1 hypothetical protein Poli38472_003627 [Pythium oligandrum]
MADDSMLLATTTVLVYADARLQGLDHVLWSIDELVDVTPLYTPDRAAALGSLRLLKRVLKRVKIDETDPELVSNWCKKAMENAIKRKNLPIVECVHQFHPLPLGLSSLNLAIAVGSLELVQWMLLHRWDQLCLTEPPGVGDARRHTVDCCMQVPSVDATTASHIQICRWLYDQGYITSVGRLEDQAARTGDLDTIRWLYEQQVPRAMTELALNVAIDNGHVEVVQYLYEREEVRAMMPRYRYFELTEKAPPALATYLQNVVNANVVTPQSLYPLEIQEWCRAQWNTGDSAYVCLSRALADGEEDAALHLLNRREVMTNSPVVHDVVQHQDLRVLRWLVDRTGYQAIAQATVSAATQGNLSVLQWLHEHYPDSWVSAVMKAAVNHRRLDVVQWLCTNRSDGCSSEILMVAASNGNLRILEYLHKQWPYLLTPQVLNEAAQHGHLKVVKWIYAHMSSSPLNEAMALAINAGHLDIVIWLRQQQPDSSGSLAVDYPALEVARWLYGNGYEACLANIMDTVAGRGDLPLLEFLHSHNIDVITPDGISDVTATGHVRVLAWCYERYPDVVDLDQVYHQAKVYGKDQVIEWVTTLRGGSG